MKPNTGTTPHRIRKARGEEYCTVCLRAIRRAPRRPSGQEWVHFRYLRWDPATREYTL